MIELLLKVRAQYTQPCDAQRFDETSRQVAPRFGELEDMKERMLRGEISREDYKTFYDNFKKSLPAICYNATFKDHRRLAKMACPSGLVMIDIDHIQAPEQVAREKVMPHATKLGLALMHITPSGEGLRVVFKARNALFAYTKADYLQEAIVQFGSMMGLKPDPACKDYSRISFIVPPDYILYRNDDILFGPADLPMADPQATTAHTTTAHTTPTTPTPAEVTATTADAAPSAQTTTERLFRGVPYSRIVEEYMKWKGMDDVVEGTRNDTLFRLAGAFRYICDDSQQMLFEVLPHFGLGDMEVRQVIASACKEEYRKNGSNIFSTLVKQIKEADMQTKSDTLPDTPPAMPRRLPALIQALTASTPDIYKPAVANAVFPSLGAHLHHTYFPYLDGVPHEATLMCVLMAGTGAGKSCIKAPVDLVMEDIRERDAANLLREKEWKDKSNRRSANDKGESRPENLIIQEVDADMTNPAFVLRTAEAQEHFLFCYMNEIDQFDALRGSGKGGQQYQIMCLAFDPGNRYGQTRVGAQSVTEKVTIRFNWNASTTIEKGVAYFRKVVADGPVSRINFCTIPERPIGAPMPVYGSFSDADRLLVRDAVKNLTGASGTIHCAEAQALLSKMLAKSADKARLTQSREYENLSFRALVIAYLKACVLYVANGCRWEKSIERFVEWSFDYDMWCKLNFFGAIMREHKSNHRPYQANNLLTNLDDTFSLDDAKMVRSFNGLDTSESATKSMLSNWKTRKFIKQVKQNIYKKL